MVPVEELHASLVQRLLSFILTGRCLTPIILSQTSIVQGLPSSLFTELKYQKIRELGSMK